MTSRPKCPDCGHAEHRTECKARARSKCNTYPTSGGGRMVVCGYRPQCPCSRQICSCGMPVSVATLDGSEHDGQILMAAIVRRWDDPAGQLAVRKTLDGTLACREIPPGGELMPGERRGTEHAEWPDHGRIAAQYAGSIAPAETEGKPA